jgi:hypothetical protein
VAKRQVCDAQVVHDDRLHRRVSGFPRTRQRAFADGDRLLIIPLRSSDDREVVLGSGQVVSIVQIFKDLARRFGIGAGLITIRRVSTYERVGQAQQALPFASRGANGSIGIESRLPLLPGVERFVQLRGGIETAQLESRAKQVRIRLQCVVIRGDRFVRNRT